MLKDPQSRTVHIIINQQQLEQIVRGLQLLQKDNTIDNKFDSSSFMFVSTEDTLQMISDLANSTESNNMIHGLCL